MTRLGTSAPASNRRFWRDLLLFVGIGVGLYLVAYAGAEALLYRTGKSNTFFKIATLETGDPDWVILGASHAMPLDFDGFETEMEQQTGLHILNLATQGAGPVYNRFAFERLLDERKPRHVLYVVDSFAFLSRDWNEDRFSDAKLVRRTPLDFRTLQIFGSYVLGDGVDVRGWLDYLTGFSKLNNRDRFSPDIWEGEAQFDRVFRPSASADKARIEYLFPDAFDLSTLHRYLKELTDLIEDANASGSTVHVIKMPVPARFHALLPYEQAFDEALGKTLAASGLELADYSLMIDDPAAYADTDHLNRTGVTRFFLDYLKPLMLGDSPQVARR